MHAFDRQADGRTDRQTVVDSNTVRMLRSRTVEMTEYRYNKSSSTVMHLSSSFLEVHYKMLTRV